MSGEPTATRGPALIIGTGLIGTSIALALRGRGVEVWLQDLSPTSLALALDMGAGTLPGSESPALVIVAAPPDVAGGLAAEALQTFPDAVVTDVASVKDAVVQDVQDLAPDRASLGRFVGSHPMAGRARSGASSAHADLFYGRAWVVVPTEWSEPEARLVVRNLANDLGAVTLSLSPEEHDQAVAAISHVPQLISSLLAGSLVDASPEALMLAGQGLRDTTRIAASDPDLWTRIVAGNAKPVARVLQTILEPLQDLTDRLGDPGTTPGMPLAPGATAAISKIIGRGNRGVSRIPGKHGASPKRWATLEVLIPDRPGQLGRLFSDLGEAGVNIEDLSLDHSAGQPVGLARIQVAPGVAESAARELGMRGWRVADGGRK